MKILFFLFFILFIISKGFSQYHRDTYQPATIFKQNNIKSRAIMWNRNRQHSMVSEIDYFNREGLVIEHIQFDSLGKKYIYKSRYEYDINQKLISDTFFNYYHPSPNSPKVPVLNSIPDTSVAKIVYDPDNRIIKKTFINSADRITYEANYTFDPLIQTEKYFNLDSSITEIIIYYDIPFVANKIGLTTHYLDGKIYTWTRSYKNFFDRSRKIKKRVIKNNESYPENDGFYFKEYEYQYMNCGLLMKKFNSNPSDNSNKLAAELFDYKFW